MKALDIPDHHGVVHYYEVLWPLAHRLIGTDLPENEGLVRHLTLPLTLANPP